MKKVRETLLPEPNANVNRYLGRSRVYGGVVPAPTEKKHRKSVHGTFAELKLEKLPTKEST